MTSVQPLRHGRDCWLVEGIMKAPAKYVRRTAGGVAALVAVAAICVVSQAQPAQAQAACPCSKIYLGWEIGRWMIAGENYLCADQHIGSLRLVQNEWNFEGPCH